MIWGMDVTMMRTVVTNRMDLGRTHHVPPPRSCHGSRMLHVKEKEVNLTKKE